MISCKTFFQLKGPGLTENPNLWLPLIFYNSIIGLYLKQYLFQNKLQRTDLELF